MLLSNAAERANIEEVYLTISSSLEGTFSEKEEIGLNDAGGLKPE